VKKKLSTPALTNQPLAGNFELSEQFAVVSGLVLADMIRMEEQCYHRQLTIAKGPIEGLD
jgi:hypothetical protein